MDHEAAAFVLQNAIHELIVATTNILHSDELPEDNVIRIDTGRGTVQITSDGRIGYRPLEGNGIPMIVRGYPRPAVSNILPAPEGVVCVTCRGTGKSG